MSNKLVVYYSRKNTTRTAAKKLSENLGCDITEIISKKKFSGPIGWINAGRTASMEIMADIDEPALNPEDYETIILCSPVWASNIPSPVRTWLTANKEKCKKIAYLLTFNGGGADKAVLKLSELGGTPVQAVYFSNLDRKNDDWLKKLETFAKEL